jgi:hypothetical protein
MNFWTSFDWHEKIVVVACAAILIFCAGAEWQRRQRILPALFQMPQAFNMSEQQKQK